MTWSVYALRSEKDSGLYIGMSSKVRRRLEEHNRGYNRSTQRRAPFQLIYVEACDSRQQARQREKFLSWGNYHRRQFEQDCTYHGVAYPFGDQHWNLRAAFSEALGTNLKFEVEEALRRVGLSFEGTSHRAIDDARNIARLLPTCLRPEGGRGRMG